MTDPKAKADLTNALAKHLNNYACVRRYDQPGEPEAGTLANAFIDLDDSFRRFSQELLPKLRNATSEQEASDVLLDIGEEFRHISYHLRDTRFYAYLQETDT